MLTFIKEIFFATDGVFFLRRRSYTPDDFKEVEASLRLNKAYIPISQDQLNMRDDVNRLRSDFKSAVRQYKVEMHDGDEETS